MSNPQDTTGSTPVRKSGTSNRGFASMDPQRQREIASEGGKAAHEKGTAHEFTSEEARAAGRKGGQARSANNRANKSSSMPMASDTSASTASSDSLQ
jgi:general stress protein YciG